ncbi:MAG: 2-hydroxychromene-2-carboxylate isomerase [Alphaproteobacteria bacterium]|nr:2-hydroxychromene-2-carboxylate isomerase [Alphaproteobacteria bacterium]
MPQDIEFYVDVASPYTYLATTQVASLAERTGAAVRWRPFLLGGVFKATGNTPPATLPARARYMLQDLYRWAADYGVPFNFPAAFPVNSLTAMRALTSLDADALPQATARMMTAYWVEGRDPSDPAVIADVLGADALAAAADPAVKAALRAHTDRAIERGAFGAPTFFVGDQMFFGNDRLHFVEAAARREP